MEGIGAGQPRGIDDCSQVPFGIGGPFGTVAIGDFSLDAAGPQGTLANLASIRIDQGNKFISREFDLWVYMKGVTLDFSRPGKPTDNAFVESFNCKFRAECLNQRWLMSLNDAVRKCEAWRRDYNGVRPYGAIGNQPPKSLVLH